MFSSALIGRISVLAFLATTVVSCGGGIPRSAGRDQAEIREADGDAIELTLRRHDGDLIELSDQRGAPVLLFFFATYDDASTASARGVARFAREALDTVVIAVALQPDAPIFSAAYVETEQPPYAVGYDPENVIVQGQSALGHFDAIPMFVMIDARGREVARHVGYASERQLRVWREDALRASPIQSGGDELGAASR